MIKNRMGGLLRGRTGVKTSGAALKSGLLAVGITLAVACGSTDTGDPTQAPAATTEPTVPNVVTSEAPVPTPIPTVTPTLFILPTRTPFPTPSPTPFPTLTPTPFVIPTVTPIATPTPFVAPTRFPTPSPTPFRTPTPTPIATATPVGSGAPSPVMSVSSIGSGQSQVHLDVTFASGTSVTATLSGPGVVSAAQQTGIAASDGRVRLTWTVNASGSYVATGTAGNFPVTGSASVQ